MIPVISTIEGMVQANIMRVRATSPTEKKAMFQWITGHRIYDPVDFQENHQVDCPCQEWSELVHSCDSLDIIFLLYPSVVMLKKMHI